VKEILNTLYVQTQGTVLSLEHETIRASQEGKTVLRLPLQQIEGIVAFGNVTITPFLIHYCAVNGKRLVWLTRSSKFQGELHGAIQGNVLLRRAQHAALSDPHQTTDLARQFIAGKIGNTRRLILRSARDTAAEQTQTRLRFAAQALGDTLQNLPSINDLNLLRGEEGKAARIYFGVLGDMLHHNEDSFSFEQRNRRPPRDPVNALLSFAYALLCSECAGALEACGLDPQVGYLHALRSGRPALALDLMEEFRAPIADRFVLALVNRQQLKAKDFEELPGGGVYLNDVGRKKVVTAWQKRKETIITHPLLNQKMQWGLVPHAQARLLARHLRGDIQHYPPFIYR